MNARYEALYVLQDKVLDLIFSDPPGMYLTGGTALSRFHLHHRYSDDLDFFSHDIGLFSDTFRLIMEKLRAHWPAMILEADARDFKRLKILDGTTQLKLDFIADRVARIGLPKAFGALYIDTVRNILSNKICAVLGRDEARDIADLLYIARMRSFNWAEVLSDAAKKEQFAHEDLLFRLSTFPVESLGSVPLIKIEPIEQYVANLRIIMADIDAQGSNSLAEAGTARLD